MDDVIIVTVYDFMLVVPVKGKNGICLAKVLVNKDRVCQAYFFVCLFVF